jgi:Large eukaryotic DNA virus major capsid protein/Major capsid protein N-terminus
MAGRASLSFLGQEDISLSGDPQVTYFIEKYQANTPFAQRVDQVIFDEAGVLFGSENHRVLPNSGDLITNVLLYVAPVFPPGVQVLDSVGTLMFQYVELYVGSELIERLYGEYIEMMYDLTIPKGKQPALQFLLGKTLQATNNPQSAYTIPLPFSVFTKGLFLNGAPVTFRIVWNPSTVFTSPPTLLTQPFTAQLNIEYTYLSEPEREFMKTHRHQLFQQVQLNQFFAPAGSSNVRCQLDLYNPVEELFFVIQKDSARGYDYTNGSGGDMLNFLELDFNTTSRIEPMVGTPQFLRIIQPLEFHTRVPDRLFYMYSFSLDPEGDAPSGSVNMSRIKNQILFLNLANVPSNVNIRIYATSYNFLEGHRPVFSNFF